MSGNKANDTGTTGDHSLSQTNGNFLVVGLGASAGGIQALKDFFATVAPDSGMAYVVILHMSPEHESKLAEILQVNSPVPVTQVRERVAVVPNHVYVIPPSRSLEMIDGHLDLKEMIGVEERRSPVDLFFRTLAQTTEERAVSVILSGTGANGSMGMKRIKEYGGVAFVQDPAEAEYKDMPNNAIATGMVDYVLPVSKIAARIASYNEHRGSVQLPEVTEEVPQTDEQALLEVFTQLRVHTGHDFSNYKRATILRRIERRLGLRELPGLPDYARYVREHPQEIQSLLKDLLISVTNFFRDRDSIEALERQVLPKLFENKSRFDPVRVWVAGCATGEEAYSIGMLLVECATTRASATIQVFATDLDQDAIQIAREGFYREAEVADVSPERLRRFFNRESDGYRVRRELRETILFAVHNVIKDPPFSRLDLISCRNLLIYLNRTAQGRVLEVLHFALNPGGHLFLGTSESIEGASNLFAVADKVHHIFRSRAVALRSLPIPEVTFRPPGVLSERERTPQELRAIERLSHADLHQRLLEQYGPPSVIVNQDYEIVHLSDGAGQYLELRGGEPTHNLLKVVRPELRLELRSALYQAVNDRTNIEARGLRNGTGDQQETINLIVRPVLREEDTNHGFILVLFELVQNAAKKRIDSPRLSDEPIARRLEDELLQAKGQLRATVEQYEIQQEELRASNEELQAMNEELRSAAEELETSKEELQSVNEELTTVNQELKIKIEELSQSNNNFQNLMNSTNIGTIFVDRSLRVRQFTPSANEIFNLISSDLGRPLMDITNKLKQANLVADMEAVLNRLISIERAVKAENGRSYIMRVAPYRTLDDRIDGLVITLVDVTALTQAEEEVRRAGEELEHRVDERTRELATSNEALIKEAGERSVVEGQRMLLIEQLVRAQEDERRRLARDLHDQFGQQLTALRLKLESLKRSAGLPAAQQTTVNELQSILQRLDTDVDFLAWELRPLALDDLGLAAALSNYVKEWSEHFEIPVAFHSTGMVDRRLQPGLESNLYRIAQEALNNCARHSGCSQVSVILEARDDQVALIVEDNGTGFDSQATGEASRQMGLLGMRERAALMGGSFEIESSAADGTTIFVRAPLAGESVKNDG